MNKLFNLTLSLPLALLPVFAKAQTGIGTLAPDPTVALHVRASAANTNGPLLLEGLTTGGTEDRVIVTDAAGRLRYRLAADLFPAPPSVASLWQDNGSFGTISPAAGNGQAVAIGTQAKVNGDDLLVVDGNVMLEDGSQLRFGRGDTYIANIGTDVNNTRFAAKQKLHFTGGGNTTELMTVDGLSGGIGIGVTAVSAGLALEVEGTQRMANQSRLQFGPSNINYTYARTTNDWRVVPWRVFNVMDRFNATELFSVNALDRKVGIKTPSPQVDFEVNGVQRMTGSQPIEFGNDNNLIYRRTNEDWRFEGRTEVNFMSRDKSAKIVTVRADQSRVGILTDAPQAALEVNGAQRMTGSNRLEFGDNANRIFRNTREDWRFVGLKELNFMNRDNNFKLMTVRGDTRRIGVKTDAPATDFHVEGTMRLTGNVGAANLATDDVLLADGNGDIRRAPVSSLLAGGGAADNLGNHRAERNVQLRNFWLSNDGNNEGLRVSNAGDVGIGTAAPQSRLHVAQGGTTPATLSVQNTTTNEDVRLALFEGPNTENWGFDIDYEGGGNYLSIGKRNAAAPYWAMDRETGHLALGNGNLISATDRLFVNGNARLSGTNRLAFGDDDDMFIERFPQAAGDALDINSYNGDIHFHTNDILITNEAIKPVAYFDGSAQRVGIGTEQTPTATLHIDTLEGDLPLRIEGLRTTPNNSAVYNVLIADANGVVYRSRTADRGDASIVGPIKGGAGAPAAVARELTALRTENAALRTDLDALAERVRQLTKLIEGGRVDPRDRISPTKSVPTPTPSDIHASHAHSHAH